MVFRGYTPVISIQVTSPGFSAWVSPAVVFFKLLATRWMLALLLVLVPAIFNLSAAQQRSTKTSSSLSPPGCTTGNCGLRSSSAYPELVIGVFQHVYDDAEMRQLYRWGKTSNVWRDFDDDLDDFLARNRVLLVSVGKAREPFILITSKAEYDGAPPLPGDLVRYVPLRPHHDAEGRKAPSRFSVLSGCIAILCRTTDGPCFKNYEEGFFNKNTGAEINLRTGKTVPSGKVVDPMTALPVKAVKSAL